MTGSVVAHTAGPFCSLCVSFGLMVIAASPSPSLAVFAVLPIVLEGPGLWTLACDLDRQPPPPPRNAAPSTPFAGTVDNNNDEHADDEYTEAQLRLSS